MKQIKWKNLVALAVLTAILVLLLLDMYDEYRLMQVTHYDMYGIVSDFIGFDTSGSRIAFGALYPGSDSARTIKISNGPVQKEVTIYIKGDIAPIVIVNEANFILEPYENKTLKFVMSAPFGHPTGVYTGEAKIVLKRKR